MDKKQKQVMTGLISAAGAVAAFFGVRALVSRIRRRSYEYEHNYAAMPQTATDMSTHGYSSMTQSAQDDPSMSPAFTGAPGSTLPEWDTLQMGQPLTGRHAGLDEIDITSPGQTRVGDNYQGQTLEERDLASIPATGMLGVETFDAPRTLEHWDEVARESAFATGPGDREQAPFGLSETQMIETDQPVAVGSLVGPLVVHLLGFHNMVTLLRKRRETEAASSNPNLNTANVRASGDDSISSLEAQLPEFEHAALVPGSLQERIVQLMERIRESLGNMAVDEDELFHMHEGMRGEICQVLGQIRKVGENTVTGFDEVQQNFGC